jgi:hypothetical protein
MTAENRETLHNITHPLLTTRLDNLDIPNNTLSLYHTNIHSLSHKFLLLTEHLGRLKTTPDIITLSDNYLNQDTHPNCYRLDAYAHKHVTDVSVYYKENMHVTLIDDIPTPNAATIIMQVHATEQKTNPIHTIISIYRRPHPDPDFITNLQATIDTITTRHPTTTITIQGDININLLKLTSQHKFTHFIIENNLHTTITTPTRYNTIHESATLIDVVLTQAATHITSGTISPPLSDHLPTYAIIHNPPPRKQKQKQATLSKRRYEKNKDKILSDIKSAITRAQTTIDADAPATEHFHLIQQTIQQIIRQHECIPNPRRKPWCTPRLRRQIRKQHELHKRRQNSPTPHNIHTHARYRNALNKSIKQQKKLYLTEQLRNTKHLPRQQTKILQTVMPSKIRNRTSPTTITYENKTHTDPTAIASALNDHFITIGHKTSNTIPKHDPPPHVPAAPRNAHPPFQLRHITLEEMTKTLNKIKRDKASDIYKIKPSIIRDLADFLAPILTIHTNKAIDEHDYPDPLKLTKVIELYKAKGREKPPNYRPISLLPIIAKLIDTLINNQLMEHLTKHNIISPTQYAFRPNSSTTLALETIINQIHKHKSNKHPTLAVYIDLSKAYDTISHEKLLHKLRHDFNFTEDTVTFFKSYFRNRVQTTHTQHAESEPRVITDGIPQGSTLSTTFFLLYINDIIHTVPDSSVYTYADDTTLVVTAQNVEELQALAQTELNNLINYFHINNLVPNPTKTNYSIFYPNNVTIPPHPPQLRAVGPTLGLSIQTAEISRLEHNKEAKLLGVMIQDDLKYGKTILKVIKKLQPTIQCFKYANKLIPTEIMKQLYYSQIFPHLIGEIPIWGTDDPTKIYIQPLIRTQKRIIRLIKNLPPRAHTRPLMTELKIMNITNLYKHRVCMQLHPFIHPKKQLNRPQHDNHSLSVAQIHDYPTRHSLQQHLYVPNPNAHRKSQTKTPTHETSHFMTKNATIWNSLPQHIRAENNRKAFKTALKEHLLHEQAEH